MRYDEVGELAECDDVLEANALLGAGWKLLRIATEKSSDLKTVESVGAVAAPVVLSEEYVIYVLGRARPTTA